jgi:hypothetical protein
MKANGQDARSADSGIAVDVKLGERGEQLTTPLRRLSDSTRLGAGMKNIRYPATPSSLFSTIAQHFQNHAKSHPFQTLLLVAPPTFFRLSDWSPFLRRTDAAPPTYLRKVFVRLFFLTLAQVCLF